MGLEDALGVAVGVDVTVGVGVTAAVGLGVTVGVVVGVALGVGVGCGTPSASMYRASAKSANSSKPVAWKPTATIFRSG